MKIRGPSWSRTKDRQVMSPLLWPTELKVQIPGDVIIWVIDAIYITRGICQKKRISPGKSHRQESNPEPANYKSTAIPFEL